MQKALQLYKSNFLSANKPLVLSTALFATALLLGSWAISLDSKMYGLCDFLLSTIKTRAIQPFYITFFYSTASVIPAILLLFLCGCCSFGFVITFFVPMYRGFSLGLVAGLLYLQYGFYGSLFFSAIILPGAFVSAVCIIFATQKSFFFSLKYFSLIFKNLPDIQRRQHVIAYSFRQYLISFLIIFGIGLFSSVIDALLCSGLSGFFNL